MGPLRAGGPGPERTAPCGGAASQHGGCSLVPASPWKPPPRVALQSPKSGHRSLLPAELGCKGQKASSGGEAKPRADGSAPPAQPSLVVLWLQTHKGCSPPTPVSARSCRGTKGVGGSQAPAPRTARRSWRGSRCPGVHAHSSTCPASRAWRGQKSVREFGGVPSSAAAPHGCSRWRGKRHREKPTSGRFPSEKIQKPGVAIEALPCSVLPQNQLFFPKMFPTHCWMGTSHFITSPIASSCPLLAPHCLFFCSSPSSGWIRRDGLGQDEGIGVPGVSAGAVGAFTAADRGLRGGHTSHTPLSAAGSPNHHPKTSQPPPGLPGPAPTRRKPSPKNQTRARRGARGQPGLGGGRAEECPRRRAPGAKQLESRSLMK